MSKHDAPFHPISYAVWYEYVSGMNRSLNAAVDALSTHGIPLTGKDVEALFNRHVADVTSETASSITISLFAPRFAITALATRLSPGIMGVRPSTSNT